jgi:starvation-inducible DNA-binding protein
MPRVWLRLEVRERTCARPIVGAQLAMIGRVYALPRTRNKKEAKRMSTGTPTQARKAQAEGHRTVVEKAYPAPAPLATPTDLTAKGAQAIIDAINPLVADLFALYVKTKNFHWHLAGAHFREYHLLFDEQADQIFDAIDLLAERVRKVGGTAIRSIGHIRQLQTIADDHDAFVPAATMVQRLLDDNTVLAKAERAAHEVCERHRDVATASILETLIDEAERRAWFLFEVTQGSENTR